MEKNFSFWPKIVEYACNIPEFIFVIRISASQNLLGFAVTIAQRSWMIFWMLLRAIGNPHFSITD